MKRTKILLYFFAFFAAVFFAGAFLVTLPVLFLAAGFFVVVFLTVFLVAVFLAGAFLAAGFLTGAAFLTGSGLATLNEPEAPTPLVWTKVLFSTPLRRACFNGPANLGPTL